jgi:branched-chain amino acid aminotransferase
LEVHEVDLARGSLYTADEVFLTGTAAEVTPIREIDGRPVGAGKPGPITQKAQALFADAVTGKLDDYRHWLTFV